MHFPVYNLHLSIGGSKHIALLIAFCLGKGACVYYIISVAYHEWTLNHSRWQEKEGALFLFTLLQIYLMGIYLEKVNKLLTSKALYLAGLQKGEM